ncbi:Sjoegren syndrome/scleroderma autoantigen 1 isoform X1 [Astyanax mexicanus]|uniref:Sjoegren syndrome/scleroderma autoantigen 1 isoform X1 n=1 Tax=Astyanax mexicanus TaxID=7994 RepID=A0A8T2KWJ2_ASTMX|nr:Sjoegren syndrome/scleroderma autoantigen 1 isoform X1 [Astyanax mexicanus]
MLGVERGVPESLNCACVSDEEDFEWEPPTEAEMKVIQARRERQDKISKLMGDYLLKGYKMLGECCELCGTILLQDKQKKNYCVACQELDSDVDKDNPALNAQAALSQVRERQLASQPHPQANGVLPTDLPLSITGLPRPEHCEGAASGLRAPIPPLQPAMLPNTSGSPAFVLPPATQPATSSPSVLPQAHPVLAHAEEAVLHKLRWATQELQQAVSVETSIQLCSLIRTCADSLRSLRELQLS